MTFAEHLCRDRKCLVVGSAPGLRLPEPRDIRVVLGANGGAALAPWVDVLVTTSHLFRDGASIDEQATVKAMRGLKVGAMWVDTKCGPVPSTLRSAVRAKREVSVPPVLRSGITVEALGKALWVSTGVWATCLAVVSGASHVTIAGVSGGSRDHSAADTEALSILGLRPDVEIL